MYGCGLILQRHGREVATADKAADPRTGIDRVEKGIVDVELLLQIELHVVQIRVRSIKRRPIGATAAIGDASRC